MDLREAARMLRRSDALSPQVPVLWRFPAEGIHRPVACISGGHVAVSGWGSTILGVSDAGVGHWAATTNVGQPVQLSVGPSGVMYAAGSKQVEAFEADGGQRWSVSPSRKINSATATGPDGSCYISDKFALHALSPQDGHVVWTYHAPPARKDAPPTIAPDGTIYYATANDRLAAIAPDGKEKWRYDAYEKLGEPLFCDIASIPGTDAQGNVYFQTRDNKMKALDNQGKEKWTVDLPAPPHGDLAPQVDGNGNLFVVAGTDLVALDRSDGHTLWKQPLEDVPKHLVAKPRAGAVVSSQKGTLEGFGGEGHRTWTVPGLQVESRPVFGPHGELLVGTEDALLALAPLDCYESPMMAEPKTDGTVQTEPGWVVIGGVRVPIRKT